MPHHGVVRSDKATTKLRIVFDGSSKDSTSEHSINDCLEKGPNLTPHIFDVLIKFRSHPVALTADVEKAFHQISINETDRDKLRFLWWDKIEGEEARIVQYRFRRLVFGLTSSPAILNGVIQHHLSSYSSAEPKFSECLADSLYVDDFPGGAPTDEETFNLFESSKRIMSEGGFNLRKWHTNSRVLKQRIDRTETMSTSNQPNISNETVEQTSSVDELSVQSRVIIPNEEEESQVKILGLNWNTDDDCFSFDVIATTYRIFEVIAPY